MQESKASTIVIIPARYAASRFPGKLLEPLAGKSVLQRVYEQAQKSKADHVLIATDDDRIFNHCHTFNANVCFTDKSHKNGTSRCIEAYNKLNNDYEIMINIQGDEPFISPAQIDLLIDQMHHQKEIQILTLGKQIKDQAVLFNPNSVKVVFENKAPHRALYFSRHPIPYLRDLPQDQWLNQNIYHKHIGIYTFRNSFISKYDTLLPSTPLQESENLEQLNWMEQGYPIHICLTDIENINIDVPEDMLKAENWLNKNNNEN